MKLMIGVKFQVKSFLLSQSKQKIEWHQLSERHFTRKPTRLAFIFMDIVSLLCKFSSPKLVASLAVA
ncbi:hypothetical protein T07_5500 [Trichinella nelsoni]|uniref:Uncharacterized protein n=1 Tax=Trichinella nelsoni TaxID=6336 RepID=A0A0V0RMN3_9BILA|nr:hypothetical protein T07_5500 [Trichinella nelsoni]